MFLYEKHFCFFAFVPRTSENGEKALFFNRQRAVLRRCSVQAVKKCVCKKDSLHFAEAHKKTGGVSPACGAVR